MSQSGFFANNDLARFRGLDQPASRAFLDPPVLSCSTWLSLFGYLFSLALTQTAYYRPFMSLRWAMLGMLAASSTADMILVSRYSKFRIWLDNGRVLIVYFFLTVGTVIYAENWMFSGMRWASHAVMLTVLMISLPQLLTIPQIQRLLSILKYLMGAMVIISWIFPVPEAVQTSGSLYQGAMGNANAMGHIAFMAALLFLHAFITAETPRIRYLSAAIMAIAMITIWKSGARSSMIAAITGILLLFYFYRKEMRGLVLIGTLLGTMGMVSLPRLPQQIFRFTHKSSIYGESQSLTPMQSRMPVWSAAYEGFKKRPLLGWGFGADSNISKKWEPRLTAVGTIGRDAVNDFLFMMEGCGIVGLGSYLLLIFLVLKQRPSRSQCIVLHRWSRDQAAGSVEFSSHHAHAVLFILPVCLLVLNQFDNSALSAGNLISATLWISAGCASALRHKIGSTA
jgi:O-antigen ligase